MIIILDYSHSEFVQNSLASAKSKNISLSDYRLKCLSYNDKPRQQKAFSGLLDFFSRDKKLAQINPCYISWDATLYIFFIFRD